VVVVRYAAVVTDAAVILGQSAELHVRKAEGLIDRRSGDIGHGHSGDHGNASY
jgi:hypothetical protein